MSTKAKTSTLALLIGAVSVSLLISGEIGAGLIGLSYVLLQGTLQLVVFAISGVVTLGFFIWFVRRAYDVEKDLMAGAAERGISSAS